MFLPGLIGADGTATAVLTSQSGIDRWRWPKTARGTRKHKRAALILTGITILGVATGLVLYALNDTIVFFYTPVRSQKKM